MPTKLVDVAEKQRKAYDTARNQATTALAEAQAALAAAQDDLAKVTRELGALDREGRDIRHQLEVIATPADAEPLLAKLEENIIASSAKRAKLLDADEQVETWRRAVARVQAELARLAAALQAATSRRDDEQRQAAV